MNFADLFQGATPHDLIMLAIIVVGIPFILMVVISSVLKLFAGLRSTPDRRALLTVLPAYAIVTLAFILVSSEVGPLGILFPIATFPVAWLIFWWFRREFSAAWVDDEAQLPEGVKLANDDWKLGLAALACLMLVAAFKMFVRSL